MGDKKNKKLVLNKTTTKNLKINSSIKTGATNACAPTGSDASYNNCQPIPTKNNTQAASCTTSTLIGTLKA